MMRKKEFRIVLLAIGVACLSGISRADGIFAGPEPSGHLSGTSSGESYLSSTPNAVSEDWIIRQFGQGYLDSIPLCVEGVNQGPCKLPTPDRK